MKKICFILALVLTLTLICGCNGYVNSYSASFLTTSCYGNSANMKFHTFQGTYNFKLVRRNSTEHTLHCNANLGEGEMNVYVGVNGEKELLLSISGGESYNETIVLDEKYNDEQTIYIILETSDKCTDGVFQFTYH